MSLAVSRRGLLAGVGGLAVERAAWAEDAIGSLERAAGGRLGVFARDTGSLRVLTHRADERFLM